MTYLQKRPMIEKAAIAAILRLIRRRRQVPSGPERDRGPDAGANPRPATLRQARFSDFAAVAELKRRCGLSADSLDNWERLWRHNPAIAKTPFVRPIGWVLDVQGKIVGYLGNISLLYRYGDRTLTAVTGSGFVVEPAYRALSVRLAAAFYRQDQVDLYLTTSAVNTVGSIAHSFKCKPLPQADYETVLFWVLRPRHFAKTLMTKLRLGPISSYIGRVAASMAVVTDVALRRRTIRPRPTNYTVSEIDLDRLGDDFQTLWLQKLNEEPRLLADRSPDALRWHFQIPGDVGSAHVLGCYNNGELLGYTVLRSDSNQHGLRTSTVADLIAREDQPEVFEALLVASYNHARRLRSDILEVLGFPQNIREVCSRWKPYRRQYPACPFYYKAIDPMMAQILSNGLAWYACPFDGDTNLIRPSYARSASPRDTLGRETERSNKHL